MAVIVLEEIQAGNVDPGQLHVIFIDEEGIYPCIERTVKEWRLKFLQEGAQFHWFALPFAHFNCFNRLANDETMVLFDPTKEDRWIRRPPPFAIRYHPKLRIGKDKYQQFLARVTADGIQVVGTRVYESVHRLISFSRQEHDRRATIVKPIYDWRDADVWKFLYEKNVEIPDIYVYMWQAGVPLRGLRVSQFFTIDSASSLVRMEQFYPGLMERIMRREPNAYIAALYWDSHLFRRNTSLRQETDRREPEEYKRLLLDLVSDVEGNFENDVQRRTAKDYRNQILKHSTKLKGDDWRKLYDGLVAGDPKNRTLRGVIHGVMSRFHKEGYNE